MFVASLADFLSEYIKDYNQILRHYPFDYIICSVHRLNDIDIYIKTDGSFYLRVSVIRN